MTDVVQRLADTIAGTQAAVAVGFTIGFLLLGVALYMALSGAGRGDIHEEKLAAHDGDLADIRGDLAAIATYLGIEITEDDDMPDTDEIPAQERPRPMPGPRTEPTEVAAVVAVTADDDWAAKWDADMAELRAKWDREDAA